MQWIDLKVSVMLSVRSTKRHLEAYNLFVYSINGVFLLSDSKQDPTIFVIFREASRGRLSEQVLNINHP